MVPLLNVSADFRSAWPEAPAGVLVVRDFSPTPNLPALEARQRALERDLRARFAGADRAALAALPEIQAYSAYYKRFKKTYHLLLQLESLAFKGKGLPRVAPLVDAMFLAEMQSLLLTAGHDLDATRPPLTLDVANGDECYQLLRGDKQILKTGDMFIRDAQGVISSVIYGPDARTPIRAGTCDAIYTTYGVPGIPAEAISAHLEGLRETLHALDPHAETEAMVAFPAGSKRGP